MSQQQYIQSMLDSLYPKLNDPASGDFYVPQLVQDKGYDPYGKFTWNVSLDDPAIISAASQICGDIALNDPKHPPCAKGLSYINEPNVGPQIELSNCVLSGLSNVVVGRPIASGTDGFTITTPMNFQTLPPNPAGSHLKTPLLSHATMAGDFQLTQNCCCSSDFKNCATTPEPQVGHGTFVVTVGKPGTGTGVMQIVTLKPGVLDLEAKSVEFAIPSKTPNGPPDISVVVKITSFPPSLPPSAQKSYNNLANEAFNSASAQKNIIEQINKTMNEPNQLKPFGKIISDAVDGYLKANHQYPFDGASAAIF